MQPPEVKTTGKRAKTPEQALAALMRLCARAEKSQDDARRLMRGWGLAEREGEQVLARLATASSTTAVTPKLSCATNCG